MRNRFPAMLAGLTAATGVAALSIVTVAGQAPSKTHRTPWGHPDLQGLYNTAWLTPLERPAPVATGKLTAEEAAAAAEKANAERRARLSLPSDPTRTAPPVGGDGSTGAAGNVGGYNNFWVDPGDEYFSINGERRASIVVDPPDGRVPPTTPEARKRQMALFARPTADAAENVATVTRGAYDNPENRPLAERCILGFGSTSGPPMLPVLYNNFKQIVQTPDHVMILVEMNHDARIIPFSKTHGPKTNRKWLGDSIAWWEGDTLVIETTNFTSKTRFRGSSEDLKVTERFTRMDDNTLLYRFTIDDPSTWTRPWSGEYPFVKAKPDEQLHEYACHEANHALTSILRGERLLDAERAKGIVGSAR